MRTSIQAQFETSSWGAAQWTKELTERKNCLEGAQLAAKVPKKFYRDPLIRGLMGECRETEEALKKVSGYMWRAIERRYDPESKGYLIVFESNPKTDQAFNDKPLVEVMKITANIFPAGERPATNMSENFAHFRESPLNELGFDFSLGSSSEGKGSCLVLPDVEVIRHRIKEFRNFPKLSILSAPGIMPDAEFLEAQFKYHVICSEGIEFVHDILIHLSQTLLFMHANPVKYALYKERWSAQLRKGLEIINKSKVDEVTRGQFINLLSYAADGLSAVRDANLASQISLKDLPTQLGFDSNPIIHKFLDRRFKEERLSSERFLEVWADVFSVLD